MKKIIKVKQDYSSLIDLHIFLTKASSLDCYIDYDNWDFRIDNKGKMEQCIVLKKNAMHAIKIYFTDENTVKLSHIMPNKVLNAYFGKGHRIRQNIIELISRKLKDAILSGPQQKAFEELEGIVKKACV